MPWFKVDDTFYSSRKVLRIPRNRRASAVGLWLMAGTWCAHELTDGRIDHHEVEELGGKKADAEALVAAGLWKSIASGWMFHDWHDYQPTRNAVMEARAKEAERKRASRERQAGVRPDTTRTPDGQTPESGHPVPTRPDPSRPLDDMTNEIGPGHLGEVVPFRTEFTEEVVKQAKGYGITSLEGTWRVLAETVQKPLTAYGAVCLAVAIAELAKDPVTHVDAYVATTCRQSPDTVRATYVDHQIGEVA